MRRPILEVSELLRTRALSPVELTKECLTRIEKLNPALNAFITVTADSALAQARQAEEEIRRGRWRGPLHGIPLGLKDLIDAAGTRTTAASGLFKDRVPGEDAEVVRRLNSAGAILLGKQNLHEFAYGGSSLISYFGAVHNPWNRENIAGGSSGGSAAAVAAGLGYGAIGTDTAGSIREPAALCGVVGLKPTYGRVSTRGVIALSASLDHVGPIAGCVADAAVVLQAIAEPGGASDMPAGDFVAAVKQPRKALRLGIPRALFYEELDPEISSAMEEALTVLKSLGNELREISLAVNTDRTLQRAESYLAHLDFIGRSPELYQPETLRRIQTGAVEWADYTRALLELKRERSEIGKMFSQVDLLVTPATPAPAPGMEEFVRDPEMLRPRELLLLRNTRPFNVWGLPAISLPCGFTESGLPMGLQIAGPHWREDLVLDLAHAYEQATEWHKREPNLEGLLDG